MLRSILSLTLISVCSYVHADWSSSVFPVKKHDFGTVAVAAKTEFRFPIHNTLSQPIHIQTVRASCGCTTPIIETEYIQPGQTGSILAKFNTPSFRGKKGATLTVVIDRPFYSEVQLRVDGYIRSDMVFHPGAVDMGSVQQGEAKSGVSTVYYAGRGDWRINNVRSNKPWLVPVLQELERGSNKVNYRITVSVREDAPAGHFQDEIVIQTNDRNMPSVPLRVTGNVETALSISPQSIALGVVPASQPVVQRLVIRGHQPFQIESIEAEGWNIDFAPNAVAKQTQIVTITMTPTSAMGAHKVPVIIRTGGSTSVTAKAILTADVVGEAVAVVAD